MTPTNTPDCAANSTVKMLISLIGEAAALRMMDVKNFGGGRFDFPKSEVGLGAQTFAALAEVVGMANAQRLCKHFGGECLYIPNLSNHYREERNRRIVTAYNAGSTVRELMREHEISDRWVHHILKTTDMSDVGRGVQESLF